MQNSANHEKIEISLADTITKTLINERSYANSDTRSVFEKIITQALSKGITETDLVRMLCQQTSLLTGMSYFQWVTVILPIVTDFEDTKSEMSFYDQVSCYLPLEKYNQIKGLEIIKNNPAQNQRLLNDLEDKIGIESAEEKWGLIAYFALKGCIHSRLMIGNLLVKLETRDPIIVDNLNLGIYIIESSILSIFNATEGDNESFIQYEAKFLSLLTESAYKLFKHYEVVDPENSMRFFNYANNNASNFSRVRKNINKMRQQLSH